MSTAKFETKESALAALTNHKKPDCVASLTREFNFNLGEGYSLRHAYYRAEVSHFLLDHDGYNNLPELTIPETDEAVREAIQSEVENEEQQGQANLIIQWFDLVRTWNTPVSLALSIATGAAIEEWDETHDLSEEQALADLDGIPVETEDDQAIKDFTFNAYRTERAAGNSVRASLRSAIVQAKEAVQRQQLEQIFSLLGSQLSGRNN